MSNPTRFKCPTCSFSIFNRRLARCESCGAELPTHLRFTAHDLSRIDIEHAHNAKLRADLAKEADEIHARRMKRKGETD